MSFRFKHRKATQVILFVLHSLGKVAEPSRLFLLLYLADIKHLAKYGSLITGDNYIAMKYGPAPLHVMGLCQQLKEEYEQGGLGYKSKGSFGVNDKHQLVASDAYNAQYLSESEVECLFEATHLYKNASFELISYIATGSAWTKADINGEIKLTDMAIDGGATPEMIAYIELSYNDEQYSFSDLL